MNPRLAALPLLLLPTLALAGDFGTFTSVTLNRTADSEGRTEVYDSNSFVVEDAASTLDGAVHPGGFSGYSGGASRASLASGQLGAASYASIEDPRRYGPSFNFGSKSFASLWDEVTFSVAPGSTLGPIRFQLALDGNVDGNVLYRRGSAADIFMIVTDLDRNGATVVDEGRNNVLTDTFLDATLDPNADGAPRLTERRFRIEYRLSARSNIGTSNYGSGATRADFMHTMRLNWALPQGTTYTSASGVFRPGAIQAVPEPATMAALGLGAAAMLRRRRKA